MNTEKNERIRQSLLATRAKRATQEAITRELKIDESKLTKLQKEALRLSFLEAKWLYNHLLTTGTWNTDYKYPSVPVRLPDGTFEERDLHLGSQVKRGVGNRIETSIKTLSTLKRRARRWVL